MADTAILRKILSKSGISQAEVIIDHAREVYSFDIPEEREAIASLEKEDMGMVVQKLNMLGSIYMMPVSRDQISALYERALELFGSPPETSRGEWIEWCLWHHSQRFDDPPIESLRLDPTSTSIGERIEDYLETRSELYKQRVAESSHEIDDPSEVPDRFRAVLFRPLLPDPDD